MMAEATTHITLELRFDGRSYADLVALADDMDELCELVPDWNIEVHAIRDRIRARLLKLAREALKNNPPTPERE